MSGIGADLNGARWNNKGHRVVYASGHLTLAMLEILVHIEETSDFHARPYLFHEIHIPTHHIQELPPNQLPPGWNALPDGPASRAIGDEWTTAQNSLALAVPSVLVPTPLHYDPNHMNYLINPNHPAFPDITTSEEHPLRFDPRLTP